ncbi:MAG: hypothetical protein MJ113_07115 [Lachnospiraceae bacterium]|nr:hypothetical protein [Lachnospiraceae bacterium]
MKTIWKYKKLIIKECDEALAMKILEDLSENLSGRMKIKKLFSLMRRKNNFFLVICSSTKDGSIDIIDSKNLVLYMPSDIKVLGIAKKYSSATEIVEELTKDYLNYKALSKNDFCMSMREFFRRDDLFV